MRRPTSPGDVLAGKYVLRERIGAGGMGVVFEADHLTHARRIAIKVLRPHLARQAVYAQQFRTEALAASRLRHRGTAEVIDFEVAMEGTPYIAMELVPGRPLGQILAEEELPLRRALGIIDQILEALHAAHACAVVHADVKSDNFLITPKAGGEVVTMIDFGLARMDGAPTPEGFVVGTPEYMAPELIRGAAPTVASDLYAAGVILYELLTGVTPFTGDSTDELLRSQLEDAVTPPTWRRPDRGIPAALDAIVLRALDKDPRARYASARDFRAALEAASLALDLPLAVAGHGARGLSQEALDLIGREARVLLEHQRDDAGDVRRHRCARRAGVAEHVTGRARAGRRVSLQVERVHHGAGLAARRDDVNTRCGEGRVMERVAGDAARRRSARSPARPSLHSLTEWVGSSAGVRVAAATR